MKRFLIAVVALSFFAVGCTTTSDNSGPTRPKGEKEVPTGSKLPGR